MRKKDPAEKLERKGDKLFLKKKYIEALEAFEEAFKLNPESSALLDKLIETHDQLRELVARIARNVADGPILVDKNAIHP